MNHVDPVLSFWEHIEELRKALLKSLAVIALAFFLCLYYYPQVFQLATHPYRAYVEKRSDGLAFETVAVKKVRVTNRSTETAVYHLPDDASVAIAAGSFIEYEHAEEPSKLILLSPVEGILIMFKTCFLCGLSFSSPVWFYFILQFIAPALNTREKKLLLPFLFFSLLFLGCGLAFAYYVTVPLATAYLMEINSSLGENLWSLSSYMNYTFLLLIASAVSFESSVLLFFLIELGWITSGMMRRSRRVSIVLIFILSALLTPPDVLSQLLMAAPLLVLYEAAVLYARMREKSKEMRPITI